MYRISYEVSGRQIICEFNSFKNAKKFFDDVVDQCRSDVTFESFTGISDE